MVPVIRKADQKGLAEIARERFELADEAAKGKPSLEELEGDVHLDRPGDVRS